MFPTITPSYPTITPLGPRTHLAGLLRVARGPEAHTGADPAPQPVERVLTGRFGDRHVLFIAKGGRTVCAAPGDRPEVLAHFARQAFAATGGGRAAIDRSTGTDPVDPTVPASRCTPPDRRDRSPPVRPDRVEKRGHAGRSGAWRDVRVVRVGGRDLPVPGAFTSRRYDGGFDRKPLPVEDRPKRAARS
ncbi:hypothetical protein AB0E83_08355 [Streptomyces sp. NPDC035033]|uniref:hypothetical protein n=1 Tax=Streptomyces sp. NPDC035033 TaxID=3155368 RepID=UPI0033C021FB